jgi:hypothetical protein
LAAARATSFRTCRRQRGQTGDNSHARDAKAFPMARQNFDKHLEEDICIHIFTVSSAMVGVCLTVIGLIRVVITLGKIDTIADDLLATDAFLFLVACLLSYWALRTRSLRRMHRVERLADGIFILAMIVMTGVCGLITFAISAAGK